MADIAIIGIGNPIRGDDGAGWAVIDLLEKKVPAGVILSKIRGEITELMDVFAKYPTVYCVDACLMDVRSGFWQRIDVHEQPLPRDNAQTSTHGFTLSQAIDMAKTLEQLPSKLIIYAINGTLFSVGDTLTSSVAQATEQVAEKILDEEDVRTCTKKV